MAQLADLRAVEDYELRIETLRQLASLSPFGAGSRRAIVVGSVAAYGLARMFQVLREGSPDVLRIFRNMEAALEWLELAEEAESLLHLLTTVPPLVLPSTEQNAT